MTLSELQSLFTRALIDPNCATPLYFSRGQLTEEREARFAIYRNNTFMSLQEVLKSTFPATLKTVGEHFFSQCCHQFISESPPEQAALVDYGIHFPNFLQKRESITKLPYLHQLAQLEFIRHKAYYAADASIINNEQFNAISPEQLAQLQFCLHPSVSMMQSEYAIGSLLEFLACERSSSRTFDIDHHEYLITYRSEYDVVTNTITKGNFYSYKAVIEGASLGEALADGMHSDPNFQAAAFVQEIISSKIIHSIGA